MVCKPMLYATPRKGQCPFLVNPVTKMKDTPLANWAGYVLILQNSKLKYVSFEKFATVSGFVIVITSNDLFSLYIDMFLGLKKFYYQLLKLMNTN